MRDILHFLVFSAAISLVLSASCSVREYGANRRVCVCNKTYCDTIDPIKKAKQGVFLKYTSNLEGLRFEKEEGQFSNLDDLSDKIVVKSDQVFQSINGFGGAITDATSINILSLDKDMQEKLMMSYFSENGIQYSLVRVPMGSSDFSTHPYTYQDTEDETLSGFALVEEDYKYKFPILKWARNLTNDNLRFFVAAWTAPKWMKSTNDYANGFLKKDCYQPWANYFVKFLDAYKKEGITFWAISTGNEPFTAFVPFNKIPSVGMTSKIQKIWLRDHLGPTIRNSSHSDIKILIMDDQKIWVSEFANTIFGDPEAAIYADGVGVHWYLEGFSPITEMDEVHDKYPDKFSLSTEVSEGSVTLHPVQLGDWSRAEKYAFNIIENMNSWVTGWADWNMALNVEGGPTYIRNFCDSPIIVNATAQEFLKQPMFYGIGHFSKFIPRGSQKIFVKSTNEQIQVTGMKRPDGGIVAVILNRSDRPVETTIVDENRGTIPLAVTSHSITTIVYW